MFVQGVTGELAPADGGGWLSENREGVPAYRHTPTVNFTRRRTTRQFSEGASRPSGTVVGAGSYNHSMTVLIDPPAWPAHGMLWSHLVSDSSLDELHAFAAAADVPARAFDLDHYDVPDRRYDELVAAGAVPVDGKELVTRLIASGLRVRARDRERRH